MKEIIGNLLKKENVRQNLSSLRQEIKDENALAEALKLLAGEDELLVSFMGADADRGGCAKGRSRKNSYLPGKTVPVYENIAWRSDTDSWRNVYRTAKWIL